MADKKSDFVVTDRRKFTSEGELRPDVREPVEQAPPPEAEAAPPPPAPEPPRATAAQSAIPSAPPAADQQQQKDAYRRSGQEIDDRLRADLGGRKPEEFHMNLERLVASLYMTAMMQLGLMHPEGEQPRPDILGARQTIDTLSVLEEKTRGNLTDTEKNLLQNCLYELRMAFVELTGAVMRAPQPPPPPPPGERK